MRKDSSTQVKLQQVRTPEDVHKDLEKAKVRYKYWSLSKTFRPTLINFSKFPPEQYNFVMGKIAAIAAKNVVVRVSFGNPEKINDFASRDFSKVPAGKWLECLSGGYLRLNYIWQYAPLFEADKTSSDAKKMTAGTAALVQKIDVGDTIDNVLKALGKSAGVEEIIEAIKTPLSNLGVDNIITYLLVGGRWRKYVWQTGPGFQKLIDEDTRWHGGVARLHQPQRSVAENPSEKDVFVVDIDDLQTFHDQEIEVDAGVVAGYKAKTIGPEGVERTGGKIEGCRRELMYIRLRDTRNPRRIIGLVALHNFKLVPQVGEPAPEIKSLLPDPSGFYGEQKANVNQQRKRHVRLISQIFLKDIRPSLADALDVTPLPAEMPTPVESPAPPGGKKKAVGSGPFRAVQYHQSSEMQPFLRLIIERQGNPTLNYEKIRALVIDDACSVAKKAIGALPPREEMEEHVFLVSESETVRDGTQVVAFGTSKYFDGYINKKGKREKLTMLWGTMVDPDHRRGGLMIKLNYDLILSAKMAVKASLRGWSILKRLFVPAPMVVRTQSRAVWEACNRHFFGVTKVSEKNLERYQHMVEYIAKEMGWELDEKNVQRDAYTSKRVQDYSSLIPGLNEHDAYIFAGDFTLWREIMTKAYVHIYYPLKEFYKARWGKRK